MSDIGGFVRALTNPVAYPPQYPECDINNADMNGNGTVTAADIGPFVAALTGQ